MKYELFKFSVDEYGQILTNHSHTTVHWLYRNGYLNAEDTAKLLESLVVVPVRNNLNFGERMLNKLFGKDSTENSYVFPLALIDHSETVTSKEKPDLKVVK